MLGQKAHGLPPGPMAVTVGRSWRGLFVCSRPRAAPKAGIGVQHQARVPLKGDLFRRTGPAQTGHRVVGRPTQTPDSHLEGRQVRLSLVLSSPSGQPGSSAGMGCLRRLVGAGQGGRGAGQGGVGAGGQGGASSGDSAVFGPVVPPAGRTLVLLPPQRAQGHSAAAPSPGTGSPVGPG